MKRFIILTIILTALSSSLIAQTKKVAVYVTGNDISINKVLGDKLVEAFVKNGKYIAVERTNSFLAELKKEQKYQRDGEVSDSEISEVGKQFGVQYVCVAEIYNVYNEKYISARLIDVESVEIINASNVNSKLDNMNELLRVSNDLTAGLTAKTQKEIAEEKILSDSINAVRISELRTKYQSAENKLKKQLELSYLETGDYYITFPIGNERLYYKDEVKTLSRSCHACGYSDWRIPSNIEVKQIRSIISDYRKRVYINSETVIKYPDIDNELKTIEQRIYDLWTKENCNSNSSRYVMLIRNAK